MPFKSKKQEDYLRINEPEVYKKFKEEERRDNGGVMIADNLITLEERAKRKKIAEQKILESMGEARFESSDWPLTKTASPTKGFIRGEAGSQNITLSVTPSKDASALVEKELQLNDDTNLYIAQEFREQGQEGTGVHIKSPSIQAGVSTDWKKEDKAYFSGRGTTPVGDVGINLNKNFRRGASGEIYWRSRDGRWNATGSTNFNDVKKLNLGYNTEDVSIDYQKDFGGNEELTGEYRLHPNVRIRGGTNLKKDHNIMLEGSLKFNKGGMAGCPMDGAVIKGGTKIKPDRYTHGKRKV